MPDVSMLAMGESMFSKVVGALAVVGCLTHASAARADGQSALDAAKAAGFENAQFAIGLNVAAVRNSEAFRQLYESWLRHDSTSRVLFTHAKTACAIDLVQSVESVVLLGNDSGPTPAGRFFVSTKGLSADRIAECVASVAREEKMSASRRDSDGLIEIRSIYGSEYIAVLPTGVIAIASSAPDRAAFKQLIAKKPATKSVLGDAVATADTSANLWGVVTEPQRLEGSVMMRSASGSFTCAKSKCDGKGIINVDTEQGARQVVQKMNDDIAHAERAADVPRPVLAIARRVSLTAAGTRLQIKLNVTEGELVKAIVFAFSAR